MDCGRRHDASHDIHLEQEDFHGSGAVVEGICAADGLNGREAPRGHGPAQGGKQVEEAPATSSRVTSAAPPSRTPSSASGLGVMPFIGGRVGLVGALAFGVVAVLTFCEVGDDLKEQIDSIDEKMALYREDRRKVQEEMMMMSPVLPRLGMCAAVRRR